jgi:hypothetical protein
MKYIRSLAIALCLTLLLPLAACTGRQGNTDTTAGEDTTASPPADTPADTEAPTAPPETESDTEPDTEPAPETDPLAALEALQATLASGIYRSETPLTGMVGFTDPAAVGVDPAAFTTVRYPIPADSDCAKVFSAADYGITPESEDNTAALKSLLEEIKGVEGLKKLVFAEGVYRFSETVKLAGQKDLYLCGPKDGDTYTFLMTKWTPGITVDSCENIHFNGLRFDYEHPSAITGEVVSFDRKSCAVTILVDEPYDLSRPEYNGGKISYGSYMEYRYDEATEAYVPDYTGNLLYNSTGDGIIRIKSGTYDPETRQLTIGFDSADDVKKGTRVSVAYTMYEHFGFRATYSQNVYLEDVWFYHTAGMAMGATAVENLYINRLRITPPEGTGRLMTATADCMHFYSCTGEVVISGCYISHSHDDALNIKGAYAKVSHNLPHEITWDNSRGTLSVSVGDVLDAYETATFRYIGSYTVTAIDRDRLTYTVAERIGEDLSGALICNASTSPSLTVENCFIGNKRNRGLLIQCREVTVRNNTFQNILHGAIQVHSVADIFAEGIMPRNVIIENNKFINNNVTDVNIFTWGPSGTTPGTIMGVTVRHNFFTESGSNAVHFLGAGKSSAEGNFFCISRSNAVHLSTSTEITVKDNITLRDKSNSKSAFSVAEDVRALTLTGNITYNTKGQVEETDRADGPLPEPPAPGTAFAPSLNALRAGFTYNWSPDGVDMDLTDSTLRIAESSSAPAALQSGMTPEKGFSTHILVAEGKGDHALSGLSYKVNPAYYKAGTVYYLTLSVATEAPAAVELVAMTEGGTRTAVSFSLTAGVQTVSLAYRVSEGDRGMALRVNEGTTLYLGNLAVELSDGGPTLNQLKSESGYTWDISATVFENSTTSRVGDLADTAAREALLAAGYSETDPVCIVKGGILQDFFKASFFVPGTTYELTFRTYAAASHGYLIAMDSTPGNFAQTGNDFIGKGYCERTVTYTVGQNGDYALTFYNIPETYLVGMTFRIVE